MCIVHSPLRDATTPYTERCKAVVEPEGFEPSSNLKCRGEWIRTTALAPPRRAL